MVDVLESGFPDEMSAALADLRSEGVALHNVWGASRHAFWPAPALPEDEVAAAEAAHGISLPPDYRAWLCQVGNGGAGPWQGLLPLDEALRQSDPEGSGLLAQPFPHGAVWLDELGHRHRFFQFRDPSRRGYRSIPVDVALDPAFMAGSLVIAHGKPKGEAQVTYRLVLNGPERHTVWRDDRAGSRSVGPCERPNHRPDRVYFRDWMREWVRDCRMGHNFSL